MLYINEPYDSVSYVTLAQYLLSIWTITTMSCKNLTHAFLDITLGSTYTLYS